VKRLLFLCLIILASLACAESVLRNETQVYTRTYTPVLCVQQDANFTVWRELAVYNTTRISGGIARNVYYSTITVYLRNDGSAPFQNFFLKEHLPDAVASTPGELFNFTKAPDSFEQGSVVVSWLFENIEPGETKSVSYTVEKKLDERVLEDYESPPVVAAGTNMPEGGAQGDQTRSGTDYTPIVLVVLLGLVGGAVYYFASRQQAV